MSAKALIKVSPSLLLVPSLEQSASAWAVRCGASAGGARLLSPLRSTGTHFGSHLRCGQSHRCYLDCKMRRLPTVLGRCFRSMPLACLKSPSTDIQCICNVFRMVLRMVFSRVDELLWWCDSTKSNVSSLLLTHRP